MRNKVLIYGGLLLASIVGGLAGRNYLDSQIVAYDKKIAEANRPISEISSEFMVHDPFGSARSEEELEFNFPKRRTVWAWQLEPELNELRERVRKLEEER